jgi:hypothetical protein
LPTAAQPQVQPPLSPVELEPKEISADGREIAAIAWRYFESNLRPATGWFDSVKGYSFTTMWDLASGIAAVACAEKLGLIPAERASELLGRALGTLNTLKLYGAELPNREYNTAHATMSGPGTPGKGTGWSALDVGRLLVWLKIVEQWHPEQANLIRATVSGWKFGRLAKDQEMFGIYNTGLREQYRQEGRLGYEQYSASGFELWSVPMKHAKDYAETEPVQVLGIELRADKRNLPHLTSEPFLLAAFELGALDPQFTQLTENMYQVQQRQWKATGAITAVSEDSLDRVPWFTYFDVYYQGRTWQCRNHAGEPSQTGCGFSTKAALGWSSLFEDDYARLLDQTARALASPGGYIAGLYPDGKQNAVLNVNTNAAILEAMLFRRRGKRPFVEKTQ